MTTPTHKQLDYILKILKSTNISDAWREIGKTMGNGPSQAKKYGTTEDASKTIQRLLATK